MINTKSFIGTLIYFTMNVLLINLLVGYSSLDVLLRISVLYILIVVISLSSIGESILCLFAGAKSIPRKDMNVKIIPILEVVLSRAKKEMPPMASTIKLRFIDDPAPMA